MFCLFSDLHGILCPVSNPIVVTASLYDFLQFYLHNYLTPDQISPSFFVFPLV